MLYRKQTEDFLHCSHADRYFDVKPCNSYLRKLVYEIFEDMYVTLLASIDLELSHNLILHCEW